MMKVIDEIYEIKRKIYHLEDEIQILREEYTRLIEPCHNKECSYYDEIFKNNCSLTLFIDECPNYRAE